MSVSQDVGNVGQFAEVWGREARYLIKPAPIQTAPFLQNGLLLRRRVTGRASKSIPLHESGVIHDPMVRAVRTSTSSTAKVCAWTG